jgi:hypothetical protein
VILLRLTSGAFGGWFVTAGVLSATASIGLLRVSTSDSSSSSTTDYETRVSTLSASGEFGSVTKERETRL